VANLESKPKQKPKGKPGRWLKRGIGLLFVVGVVAATVMALMPKPVPVDIAVLARGPMRVTIDEDGKTRVTDRYLVSAPLAGTIGRMTLHPGDPVEQGGLIATIEATEPPLLDAQTRAEAEARLKAAEAAKRQASATVNRAKAAADFASNERDRTAGLVGKGSYAQRNLDLAELDLKTREQELASAGFGVRVAQYEVEMARATLQRIDAHASVTAKTPVAAKKGAPSESKGKTKPDETGAVVHVNSPITGTVLRVLHEHEGVVTPGVQLLELADPNALELVVDVLTSDAVQIERGAMVEIRGWGGDLPLSGRVRLVEPSAFTKISALGVEEQRVNVVIELLDKPEGVVLGDGYRVEVSIIVWESDDVLLLPVAALFRDGERWAVWVNDGGFARLQEIELGKRQGLWVEAAAGLEAGDTVIVHPSDAITEGVEVEVHAP
jgi:HlyD family secretion protein